MDKYNTSEEPHKTGLTSKYKEPEMENQDELEMVETRHYAQMKQDLEELEKDERFKRLILDGYMKDKVLDSVSLLGEPSTKVNGDRPNIMEDLVAISNLGYYFKMVKTFGASAEETIANIEGPEVEE